MRAKAGDPPRTMAQKVLAGRASDPSLSGELVEVRVDQVVLSRHPARAVAHGLAVGLQKSPVEVVVAYAGRATTDPVGGGGDADVPAEALAAGAVLARAGAGFAGPVHLERFASPARLCVTDDPRLAGSGGAGMLTLVASAAQLGQALATGAFWVRPPRSLQVQLSGRLRPFVCARDAALELLRRGLAESVRRIEVEHGAPVVVEFGGPGARLLSVGERAVLCAVGPEVGAAGAVFVSDERTEVFLRDQRRSKAFRALVPDAGAPSAGVLAVDLGAIDPLLVDEAGAVRPVRDLAGKPVSQVVLGGDGVTLRDMFAVAALLKSKRVPSHVEWLVAPPSRQMLESLAGEGALADLLATGARLLDPDARVLSGTLYPAPPGGVSVRSFDPPPRRRAGVVASAETLAYSVAHGVVGDPRSFKRPVRVTVPRTLPTDDVLLVREKGRPKGAAGTAPSAALVAWKPGPLDVVEAGKALGAGPVAVACATIEDARWAALAAEDAPGTIRAIVGPAIPGGLVSALSGAGVYALASKEAAPKKIDVAAATAGKAEAWLARGVERAWTQGRPAAAKR